ncbi:MAG: hypothetical protein NZ610_05165 [Candidatus Bipolaricaulota bacterium]|nr:hypothetical protein [Candidatus Bipolaricaulota bacterium]MCS7274776.1 hypothetical protein [Candidatus Bipolaricaulota bacterium]MDW8110056.1 hypothetical protein [Candidatus Bipolaricaulota bacterium]MDW8329481.1 hypothetical protein [Candidatus Bipolaricaulota bacterium]
MKRLSWEEKRRLVRLVPELLRLDEEFLLQRWRSAREDLECGRLVTPEKALAKTDLSPLYLLLALTIKHTVVQSPDDDHPARLTRILPPLRWAS